MISFPAGPRTWLVAGVTGMRCSFNGLAAKVQNMLCADPFSGHLFIFRGRRGDMVKILRADADDLCLFTKRLERGRFVWPVNRDGRVHLTRARCWRPGSEALSRWTNTTSPALLRAHHGTRHAI